MWACHCTALTQSSNLAKICQSLNRLTLQVLQVEIPTDIRITIWHQHDKCQAHLSYRSTYFVYFIQNIRRMKWTCFMATSFVRLHISWSISLHMPSFEIQSTTLSTLKNHLKHVELHPVQPENHLKHIDLHPVHHIVIWNISNWTQHTRESFETYRTELSIPENHLEHIELHPVNQSICNIVRRSMKNQYQNIFSDITLNISKIILRKCTHNERRSHRLSPSIQCNTFQKHFLVSTNTSEKI
jgi:hypothetical protein